MRAAQYRTEGFTANQPRSAFVLFTSTALQHLPANPNQTVFKSQPLSSEPFTSAFQFSQNARSMIQENSGKVSFVEQMEANCLNIALLAQDNYYMQNISFGLMLHWREGQSHSPQHFSFCENSGQHSTACVASLEG